MRNHYYLSPLGSDPWPPVMNLRVICDFQQSTRCLHTQAPAYMILTRRPKQGLVTVQRQCSPPVCKLVSYRKIRDPNWQVARSPFSFPGSPASTAVDDDLQDITRRTARSESVPTSNTETQALYSPQTLRFIVQRLFGPDSL